MEAARAKFENMVEQGIWIPTSTNDDHYEQKPKASKEKRKSLSPTAKGEYGKSGRFYIRNPFGKGKYEIAMFESEKAYRNLASPTYISEEQMMEDLDTIDYYDFSVTTPEGLKTYYTHTDGKLIDDESSMEEMLDLLYRIHGRENVKFEYRRCTTTSLESLA